MIIALDYDNTFTRDPDLWKRFLTNAVNWGHTVYCVTMRYTTECDDVKEAFKDTILNGIIATGRHAKRSFCFGMGISIDVWIDDMPDFILGDALDTDSQNCGFVV